MEFFSLAIILGAPLASIIALTMPPSGGGNLVSLRLQRLALEEQVRIDALDTKRGDQATSRRPE